jgi:hypothetical protein
VSERPRWERSRWFRVVVYRDIQRTTQNGPHGNKWQAAELKKDARRSGFYAWEEAGKPQLNRPVRVHAIVRRSGRKLDEANIVGACKPLLDGVFAGLQWYVPTAERTATGKPRMKRMSVRAMLPDDSPKWLRLGRFIQRPHRRWKGRERVTFLVELLPEQPAPVKAQRARRKTGGAA